MHETTYGLCSGIYLSRFLHDSRLSLPTRNTAGPQRRAALASARLTQSAGPRTEGFGVEASVGGSDAFGDERDGGDPSALAARDGDVGDRPVEPEIVGPQACHVRRAHPGPVHWLQPDAG